ncbi:unnamed protein product [Adineta steineri]|uniref:NHL repeat containing protein n=1 Tax=Adineta steineri TaxID=433720 RepID=A0A813TNN6_9BILA|nr:unnamed protein product [Adineta steineri]CAF0833043.1 unnamed protein product [Adineta steineri]
MNKNPHSKYFSIRIIHHSFVFFSLTEEPLKWKKSGLTIIGGGDTSYQLNELNYPRGICMNVENNYIYIADSSNNRIMQWKIGSNNGEIVAGGNEDEDEDVDDIHQLLTPSDVIIDKYNNNSLIICDQNNRRVVRWFHQNEIDPQIIISDFMCEGLALGKDGSLYITIFDGVLRLNQGDKNGIIVAGGNDVGSDLNQLDNPTFILVDDDYSIYISDTPNNRIMKWGKDAKEGIIFASGNDTSTLDRPLGLAMDHLGQIYIADSLNHRIIRWREGDKEGEIIIGGNGFGNLSTQLNTPQDLVFDKQGNLYVSDAANNRIQKFEVDFA